MENNKANMCIECTVNQCKHHCADQNFCSLDRIKVVTHEENPTVTQCTDCHSFEVKSSCCAQSPNGKRRSSHAPPFFL